MTRRRIAIVVVASWLAPVAGAPADENLRVLPAEIDGVKATDMMNHYLRKEAGRYFEKWKEQYEQRKTPEQIAEYQKRIGAEFLEAIGEFPERTALKPQVTGVVRRDGYRVEKVLYQSQPNHYVSALLFLPDPDSHKGPCPGVLVPCGHSRNGKAHDAYQTMGALLALNGMAALVFDPIDQGERSQMPEKLPELWGTRAHTMIGVGSILLGRNTAWFEIWDGMRGIDYLQSRAEIDPERIGCTGNSGGGTQTSYLMSLDDRIKAAAPSCYITNFYERILELGAQDAEQNIYGQLAFGMDHADYLMLRAPCPILVCAATEDFFDIRGTWQSFRYAKRLYSRMGFSERIDIIENDAPHNYNTLQRQAVVRWMSRWLLGRDEPITEPAIELLNEEETTCAPNGLVMSIEGARSTYDINRDREKALAKRRRKLWAESDKAELLGRVRQLAGVRRLSALGEPEVRRLEGLDRPGVHIQKLILKPEPGIYLPALMFTPAQGEPKGAVLYVHEQGKAADAGPGGPIEKLAESGKAVLAVDLRGTGETQQTGQRYFASHFGSDGQDVYTAYLLKRSYVGLRAEDVIVCARFLRDSLKPKTGTVELVAVGNVGVPALHAAALEPGLFGAVELRRTLLCWSDIVKSGLSSNQLVNAVHAALTTYDLPDLAATLGDKLTIVAPLDALGRVVEPARK